MKTKILKDYIYNSLGFPVILHNVTVQKIFGEDVLDIDYTELQESVLIDLCHKRDPLTGQELKFIRKYFEKTTTLFGQLFGCSHAAVLKWEKHGDQFAKVDPGTEVCIRLFIQKSLQKSVSKFKELFDQIDISHLANCQKRHRLHSPHRKRKIRV